VAKALLILIREVGGVRIKFSLMTVDCHEGCVLEDSCTFFEMLFEVKGFIPFQNTWPVRLINLT
jgi:hypothetical protein